MEVERVRDKVGRKGVWRVQEASSGGREDRIALSAISVSLRGARRAWSKPTLLLPSLRPSRNDHNLSTPSAESTARQQLPHCHLHHLSSLPLAPTSSTSSSPLTRSTWSKSASSPLRWARLVLSCTTSMPRGHARISGRCARRGTTLVRIFSFPPPAGPHYALLCSSLVLRRYRVPPHHSRLHDPGRRPYSTPLFALS